MKYTVPIYVVVDVPTPEHAHAIRQAVERLLQHEMVRFALQQSGVTPQQITVAAVVPTPHAGGGS